MKTQRSPSELRAAEEAALWRAKLDGDEAGEEDWLAYEAWLAASPEHQAAARHVDETLVDVELSRDAISASEPSSNVIPLRSRRWFMRPVVWAASAAAVAAAALTFVVMPPATTDLTYLAPPDRDLIVALPDGTSAHLNRGAEIQIRYGRERLVQLTRGEASFDVHHDPSRPFEVAAGDASVRDIGTEFNVARNGQILVVTVRSGVVEVTSQGAASTRIVAGEQGRLANGVITVAPAHADDAFAWQSGHLIYHDTPLAAVLEDLNRYSAKPIVLDVQDATDLRFTGILIIGEPSSMLARLQSFLPIRARDEGDRIVVRSST